MNADDEPLLLVNINRGPGVNAVPEPMLRELLDFCYRSKRKTPASVDLLVATDPEMAKMNRRHLGRNNATDVLAFDDGEEEDGRLRLGDVAISADTARREAARRGIESEHELAFYALHGLLHLMGMRDDTDDERALMHREQAKAMRGFGLAVNEKDLQLWQRDGDGND